MAKKRKRESTRPKKEYPKRCYGEKHHAEGCRPARPLCRWMRKVQPQRRPCCCGAYHYPHRSGSGRCGNPELMATFVWGPNDEACERDAIENEGSVNDDRPSGVYRIGGYDDYSETGTDDIPF